MITLASLVAISGWVALSVCYAGHTADVTDHYVVHQEERTARGDEAHTTQLMGTWIRARRSDGSLASVKRVLLSDVQSTLIRGKDGTCVVDRWEFKNARPNEIVRELRFSDGRFVRIFDRLNVKTTLQHTPEELHLRELDPASHCLCTYAGERKMFPTAEIVEPIPEEEILGYRAYRITELRTSGASSRSPAYWNTWFSPDFDCSVVRKLRGPAVFAIHKGLICNEPPHILLETVKIAHEEPPEWIFDVPDYREMPPIEAEIEYLETYRRTYGLPPAPIDRRGFRERYGDEEQKYLKDHVAERLRKH